MYTSFFPLLDFLDDENFSAIKEALRRSDVLSAFNAAHALKGVVGNLGMDSFYYRLHPVVEKLRSGDADGTEEEIKSLEKEYENIKKLIRENIKKEV